MKVKKIVIIEDDEILLSLLNILLVSYLEEFNLKSDIYLFSSCHQYLNEFGSFPPDLIFSDVNMPGISGLELLKKLRSKIPSTFYVIMSGMIQNRISAMELGADYFLEKPFGNEEIQAIVKKIV